MGMRWFLAGSLREHVKAIGLRGLVEPPEVNDVDGTVIPIQALIPIAPRVVGKALEPLPAGNGVIQVLVTLQ